MLEEQWACLHSAGENVKCIHSYLEKQFHLILKAENACALGTSHFGPGGTYTAETNRPRRHTWTSVQGSAVHKSNKLNTIRRPATGEPVTVLSPHNGR